MSTETQLDDCLNSGQSGKRRNFRAIGKLIVVGLVLASPQLTALAETQRLPIGAVCEANERCDRTTGCIIPVSPFDPTYNLPEGPQRDAYYEDLSDFRACRLEVIAGRMSAARERTEELAAPIDTNQAYIARKVLDWNGPIFWEPASKSSNPITRAGDEVRAVFGPIPPVDCRASSARTMVTEVDGNLVDLKPNPNKPGSPLEFEHRDVNGNIVKWTTELPKCDKPSVAGGVTFCGLNSRIGLQRAGNVEWMILCRKSKGLEVEIDPYWQESNPVYALLGYIGFNVATGEVAFFDGATDGSFSWQTTTPPPGGFGYADPSRDDIAKIYDPDFRIRCEVCHDNKEPRIVNPHIQLSRVGYRTQARARRFGLRSFDVPGADLLPEDTRGRFDPYRIVGTGFSTAAKMSIERGRSFRDPSGRCTGCHGLTTLNTGVSFAFDAVARGGDPDVAAHRTDWALRSGAGKVHPWMLANGSILAGTPLPDEISDADWAKVESCINGNGGAECDAQQLYTECPAPEAVATTATRLPDLSGPEDFATSLSPNPDGDNPAFAMRLSTSWKYLNSLGAVPTRDDVRFVMAIREVDLPADQSPPAADAFPTIDQIIADGLPNIGGEVYQADDAIVLRDISFAGHEKWTNPAATTSAREYRVDVPAQCNKRYLLRIVPKRFCFDQSSSKHGSVDHTIVADVTCP